MEAYLKKTPNALLGLTLIIGLLGNTSAPQASASKSWLRDSHRSSIGEKIRRIRRRAPQILTGVVGACLFGCVVHSDMHENPHRLVSFDPKHKSEDWGETDPLPQTLNLREKIFNWGVKFRLEDDKFHYGSIDEKLHFFDTEFALRDSDGALVASAYEPKWSWTGNRVEVKDAGGAFIGSLEEQIWQSLLSISTVYKIKDRHGKVIGESDKTSFLVTRIEIKDPSGKILAVMTRPPLKDWSFNLKGHNFHRHFWTINILEPDLDSRLWLMAPAFVSKAQMEYDAREAERQEEEAEKQRQEDERRKSK